MLRSPLPTRSAAVRGLRAPSFSELALACLVLLLADAGSQLAGDSFFPGGPLDELAHLATTLLVLWALGPSVCRRFALPALIASVAIDVDHVPSHLGYGFFTAGTPRPYTHSLTSILVVLVIGFVWRRRRDVLLGVALGLAVHFFRDLAEPGSGVALLWPLTDYSFSLSHWIYLALMAVVALIVVVRIRRTP